jgi:hypothetical protein
MSSQSKIFIEETKQFWEIFTDREISDEEARQIIANVVGYFRTLTKWSTENGKYENSTENFK